MFFDPPGGDEVLQKRSYRLALAMQDHVAAAWDSLDVTAPSRGVRTGFVEGRKGRAGTGYDILGTRHIEPAPGAEAPPIYSYVATLVEAGTASHPPESYVLVSEEGNRTLARAHREAVNHWMMAELALGRLSRQSRCPDPAALTGEQIAFLAEQEVTAGRTEEKVIAVTFDAGSGVEPWPTIRAACAEAGLRPTVFLTGIFVRQHPEVVRQMLADGYDLQSHSDTHPNLTELDSAAVQAEFAHLQEALDAAVGAHVPLCLWRPPFGARNAAVRRAAAELGLLEVYWSAGGDTTGWRENTTAERVIRRVTSSLLPGQIYVMHIDSWADAEALPSVLAEAEARGYTVGDVWAVLTEEQTLPGE
jgi:peptidoglycan/xylan/chitin deacetylase (PgdA/CDA1 family)